MEELWKDIPNYEGLYQVSSFGRVRSLNRYSGNHYRLGCIKKIQTNHGGYQIVSLVHRSKSVTKAVHRLVGECFLGVKPSDSHQINHIDGDKFNNNKSNLEWCTPSENARHRFNILGHIGNNRALSKSEVFEILSQSGKNWRDKMAVKFNVSIACIKAVSFLLNSSCHFL